MPDKKGWNAATGSGNQRAGAGKLKADLTMNTSARAGRIATIRHERDVSGQNKKGLGNPYK